MERVRSSGIGIHADAPWNPRDSRAKGRRSPFRGRRTTPRLKDAAVNVNIWLTPDSACKKGWTPQSSFAAMRATLDLAECRNVECRWWARDLQALVNSLPLPPPVLSFRILLCLVLCCCLAFGHWVASCLSVSHSIALARSVPSRGSWTADINRVRLTSTCPSCLKVSVSHSCPVRFQPAAAD